MRSAGKLPPSCAFFRKVCSEKNKKKDFYDLKIRVDCKPEPLMGCLGIRLCSERYAAELCSQVGSVRHVALGMHHQLD